MRRPRQDRSSIARPASSATYGSLAAKAATLPPPDVCGGAAEGSEGLQDHRQGHAGRRQPVDRHRQAALQHRLHAARHALRGVREVPGVRRQGRSAPTSTRSRRSPASATRSSSRARTELTGPARAASRSSPTPGGRRSTARKKLKVQWDEGPTATQQQRGLRQAGASSSRSRRRGLDPRNDGDVDTALSGAAKVVEARLRLSVPLARAARAAELHGPIQGRQVRDLGAHARRRRRAVRLVAKTLGVPEDDITIHMMRAGGGFGRRLEQRLHGRSGAPSRRPSASRSSCCGRAKTTCTTTSTVPAGSTSSRAASTPPATLVAWRNHFVSYGEGQQFAPSAAIGADRVPRALRDRISRSGQR